jgi:hypothetical protein
MSALDEILKLAQDCFAKGHAAVSPSEKILHLRMGDDCLRTAEEMQRERPVIQAAFPKPDFQDRVEGVN